MFTLLITATGLYGQESKIISSGEVYNWRGGIPLDRTNFGAIFMGRMHSEAWSKPVPVPVIRVGDHYSIDDRGGDTLLLTDSKGHRFQLVPVSLPENTARAFFPYGMVAANEFADHLGIPVTPNGWVQLADDSSLGRFRNAYGGTVVMLEQLPGPGTRTTEELLASLLKEPELTIDAHSYLKIRLLQMWLGDWQQDPYTLTWEMEGTQYRPVVRHWSVPFFAYDGLLPVLFNRKWGQRQWQNFDEKIRDLAGLTLTSLPADRRLLATLDREDWLTVVRDIRNQLPNDLIGELIGELPGGLDEATRQAIIRKLEMRKYQLEETALDYYAMINDRVNLAGTMENDQFIVQRLPGGGVDVKQFGPEGILFTRIFTPDVTREIRIFGLAGDDTLSSSGASANRMFVRLAGGEGDDLIRDQTGGHRLLKKTVFYDTEHGNRLYPGRNARIDYTLDQYMTRYDPQEKFHSRLVPVINVGFNTDDQFFPGGAISYTTHGFGRIPYATRQQFHVNGSFARNTLEAGYNGDFTKVFGPFGTRINLLFQLPHYTTFHGYGNATTNTSYPDYYEARLTNVEGSVFLTSRFKHGELYGGPVVQVARAQRLIDTYLGENIPDNDVYSHNQYVGAQLGIDINTLDDSAFPENGILWRNSARFLLQSNNDHREFAAFHSALSGYYTFPAGIPVTLAGRIGAGTITGDFAFYQSQVLGGGTGYNRGGTLRGYVRDRFRGRSVFYQNLEVRAQIVRFRIYESYLLLGASVFIDNGKVWYDGEDSGGWHNSLGAGLFLRPSDMATLVFTYAGSEEDRLVTVGLGFFF